MLDPSAYDRIDRYLDQEMSAEESSAFVAELRQDEELAAAFELRRQIYLAAWRAGVADEQQRLDTLGRDLMAAGPPDELPDDPTLAPESSTATVKPLFQRRWFPLAVAAAVAVLLLVVWRWQPQSPEQLGRDLYAAYHDPDAIHLSTNLRGTTQQPEAPSSLTDSLLRAGQAAREQDQYQRLATILDQLAELHPEEQQYAYYRAVAYLKAQAYAQAEQAFAQISQEHEQYNEARWQRALLLLRLGRLEEAKRILSDLNRLDGYAKQEEVTAILKQLPADLYWTFDVTEKLNFIWGKKKTEKLRNIVV